MKSLRVRVILLMELDKIIIVDKQHLYREGLKSILEEVTSLQVVASLENVYDLYDEYKVHQPSLVLLEFETLLSSTVGMIEFLLSNYPKAKIAIITDCITKDCVIETVRAGVEGYLLKDMNAFSIRKIVKEIINGVPYIAPRVMPIVLEEFIRLSKNQPSHYFKEHILPYHLLTKRECDVLQLMAEGQSNITIGESLCISDKTVKNHVSSILFKMKVQDRTQAVVLAIKKGWVIIK